MKKKDTSFKFVKKITMPGFGESLGYIKCYHLSSPRRITSASNPIRYNCNKICSCSRRPKTILEIRIEVTFLKVIKKHIIIYCFSYGHFPTFLNTVTTNETFQQSGTQNSFRQILNSSVSMYKNLGS